jgi:hypothetical protein
MSEKSFAGEPQENGGVFPHRPEHGEIIEMLVRFPEDVDTLVFELP